MEPLMAASEDTRREVEEIRRLPLRCARPSASPPGHELTAEQRLAIEAAAARQPVAIVPHGAASRALSSWLPCWPLRPWSWSPSPSLPAPRAGHSSLGSRPIANRGGSPGQPHGIRMKLLTRENTTTTEGSGVSRRGYQPGSGRGVAGVVGPCLN